MTARKRTVSRTKKPDYYQSPTRSTGKKAKTSGNFHMWFICTMCGPAVRCGTCGNNSCSGGYGRWPKDSETVCPDCPSAYRAQTKQGQPADFLKIFKSLKFVTPTDRIFGRVVGKA